MDQFSNRSHFRIPFIDFQGNYRKLRPEIERSIQRVMKRQWHILGPEVERFEVDFARLLGAKYCVGVGSGFDALKLSLMALGLKSRDEVVLPANTFIATYLAVVAAGAQPVLCDVEEDTQNMSLDSLQKAVTARTKAIIPVHLYGSPCPMHEICAFAKKRGLRIIEDAAQAHGGSLNGRHLGTFGDFGAFSVYPGKNLGSFGDGGAIACRTRRHYEDLLKLRNYGFKRKNYAQVYGENSRLDEIQAAILLAKLPHLSRWNRMRNRAADHYRRCLNAAIKTQSVVAGGESCYHTFVIRIKNRDRVYEQLRKRGIEAMIHYPWPVHRQPVYRKTSGRPASLPISEKLSREVLSLPVDIHMNKSRVEEVARCVNRLVEL